MLRVEGVFVLPVSSKSLNQIYKFSSIILSHCRVDYGSQMLGMNGKVTYELI